MLKTKYYFIVLSVLILIVSFNNTSLVGKTEDGGLALPIEPPTINHAAEIQEILHQYDSLLCLDIQESGAVGAAVVISYKGQIALMKCFGTKKTASSDSIDENTIFRLASVSKAVTGVLAGILANEKVIDLDDKIKDYIPDFRLKTKENTDSLTLRHILSHTSGMIPHAFDLMVEDHVPLDQMIAKLNEVDITAQPGKEYSYQNVTFSIFDPVVCTKTHKSFDEVLREKVFLPFGMKDASTGFEAFKNNPNKAIPHGGGDRNFRPIPLNDRYYNTAPAAGVNASISDLGQFLIAVSGKDYEIIPREARNLVFTPQVETHLRGSYFRSWDRVDSKQYSLGWRIVDYKNHKVAYHGGYVAGYRSEIAFCEEEEIGIAFLTNSPNSLVSKSVPMFLNLFFANKLKLVQQNTNQQEGSASKS